jgi:hypothetical protein
MANGDAGTFLSASGILSCGFGAFWYCLSINERRKAKQLEQARPFATLEGMIF